MECHRPHALLQAGLEAVRANLPAFPAPETVAAATITGALRRLVSWAERFINGWQGMPGSYHMPWQ